MVNHNVPRVPKGYVHRVGRAARAGRPGSAITFVSQYDVVLVEEIEKMIGKTLEELRVNDKKVSLYVTEVLVAKREAEIKLDEQRFGEKREINRRKQMILEGIEPEEADEIMRKEKEERKTKNDKKVEISRKRIQKLGDKGLRKFESQKKN